MESILSEEISSKLKLLCNPSVCDDELFVNILEKARTVLKSHATQESPESIWDTAEVNSCFTALLVLMTESCRHGLEEAQLDTLLKDHNFSNTRSELLLKLYESVRTPVTSELDSIGNHSPHIVGANWSLDYCVKDSGSERVNALEFLVDLQTQGVGGAEGTVQFSCSLDEMQDLVGQLREASKHIEKLASG